MALLKAVELWAAEALSCNTQLDGSLYEGVCDSTDTLGLSL